MKKVSSDFDLRPWHLIPSWLNKSESHYWMKQIQNSLDWYRPIVRLYGKKHVIPRMCFFLADSGIKYKYSGTQHFGDGWPEWFSPLLKRVNVISNVNFNGCLLNLYRSGSDSMGWHSDNEPELDSTKSIASLSLGSSRDFFIRNKETFDKQNLSLGNGDLLIMYPDCQLYWEHSLPKRRKVLDSRINLTFRRYRF
tara:strand:+ start:617 stop:1201 length:585 start_codon:yes stop_codon:yes gene_type:complete